MENEIVQASNELSLGSDQLLFIAEQAEKRVAAVNTIMKAALKMTTYLDWVLIGGNPYLQETGASKIARLLEVSWQIEPPYKTFDDDNSGHYSYRANGKFCFAGAEIDAYGLRSTREEFFIGSVGKGAQKKPQDVDERDVMQAAYTNCLNNGIKRIVPGLRNITIEHLQESGIDTSRIKGYSFNSGAAPEMSADATNKRADIERMLKEMCGEDRWRDGLRKITTFIGRDGSEVPGKTDINRLSEKMVLVTYGKVKTEYEKWVREHGQPNEPGQPNDSQEAAGGGGGEDQDVPMQ